MCGLAGILRLDGGPADEERVRRIGTLIRHRGPDASGTWAQGPVAFAHQRLSIRDLSSAANQPFHDPAKRVVVIYNGEIYNEAELRDAISKDTGYQFRTRCDTELIPAAYLAWGPSAFERFNGMFAFALWDRQAQALYLVRDPAGMKPLYYCVSDDGNELVFASEIKSVLGSRSCSPGISANELHRFLAQGYCSPHTSYLDGMYQVRPGVSRCYRRGSVTEHVYWQRKRHYSIRSLSEAADNLNELFGEVVRDHLVSDTQVASFQSGGVDSSLISHHLQGSDVTLITASFDAEEYDETSVARWVANSTSLPHLEVNAMGQGMVETVFNKVVHASDGQLADSSALAVYHLCKATAAHFKVTLGGDGADEHFAGYPTYRASRVAAWTGGWLPTHWMESLASAVYGRSTGVGRYPQLQTAARFIAGWAQGAWAHPLWRRYLGPREARMIYGRELVALLQQDPFDVYRAAMSSNSSLQTVVERCLWADQHHYLPADMLMKVDAMSMAHSLEVRLPFLDKRVLEFASTIHPNILTPILARTKPVLRASLARRGCLESIVRGRKSGFNIPFARLLRTELAPLGERMFGREADRLAPWFDPAGLYQLWREHHDGARDHGYALWALLTFAVWYAGYRP